MPRSFDNLARHYQFLERMLFGDQLNLARRKAFDDLLIHPQKILLIGDGDGRFCQDILTTHADVDVVSIDSSSRMLDQARERLIDANLNLKRVEFIEEDVRLHHFPKNEYDFIALNFVLDCFGQEDLDALLPRIEASLKPTGYIGYSDFAIPNRSIFSRFFAKIVVSLLYIAFRMTTDLQANRLPNITWSKVVHLVSRNERLGGMIISELRCQPLAST